MLSDDKYYEISSAQQMKSDFSHPDSDIHSAFKGNYLAT